MKAVEASCVARGQVMSPQCPEVDVSHVVGRLQVLELSANNDLLA